MRTEIPGQLCIWDESDVKPAGKRIVADALDVSIDDETFAAVLTYAANVALKRFRCCIPRGMSPGDFKQELIVKIFARVKRWRNQGKKTFKNYATDIAKNAAKDILRKDALRAPVEFCGEFHSEPSEDERGKGRWNSDRLTQEE